MVILSLKSDIVAGNISVSADVTFTLEPNFMFTLTCISTGGPATTVTWTRDSVTVTGIQRSHVEDAVTAKYTHTLTLQYSHTLIETQALEGLYKCSVSNAVSFASSAELHVHGIETATQQPHMAIHYNSCIYSPLAPSPLLNVSVSQNGLRSLLVSWTSENSTATGYVIHYQQHQPQQQRFLLVDEADATSATITGLRAGATYSISVASTSGTLPSTVTAASDDVTIGTESILNAILC